MPIVGLQFDLSAWRSGVQKAAALVKKNLSGQILSPFDRAVKRTVGGMKTASRVFVAAFFAVSIYRDRRQRPIY